MYGLAVNLIMSVSGHPSIINEIKVKLMTFAFAGQIFQFVARQNDIIENLVLVPKLFWA